MAQHRKLGEITVISDDDTGMYHMGECTGGFNGELKKYLQSYGDQGFKELSQGLVYLSFQLMETYREVNQEKTMTQSAESVG